MTSFRYEAVDAGGKRRRGLINADTPRRARREIVSAGLTPLSIKSVRGRTVGSGKSRARRPSSKAVIAATRQLATLIDAGSTVEESLAAVASQTKGTAVADILSAVRARIIEGWRLSDAMGEFPDTFSELYRGIVAAGEASGNLGPVMMRLADMVEKNRAMLMRAVTSLIYPAAIFVVAVIVIAALMHFVVPQIVSQIARSGQTLPLITQIVIVMSNGVRDYGLIVLGLVVASIAAIIFFRRRPGFRRAFDKAVLALPLFGGLARDLDAARFARTLSTLFASGTPLLDSLGAARRTVTNAYVKDRLELTLTSVREGASLSAAIRRADVFPPMMASMIAAGERSGRVPDLLERTAIQMEETFDAVVTVALRLLEPAVIVTLGGVVMMIVLAVMLPILQINSSVF